MSHLGRTILVAVAEAKLFQFSVLLGIFVLGFAKMSGHDNPAWCVWVQLIIRRISSNGTYVEYHRMDLNVEYHRMGPL